MIALVHLGPPPGFDRPFVSLQDLPAPPAAAPYDVFVVRCDSSVEVDSVLTRFAEIRAVRPDVPLVLVCDAPLRVMAFLVSSSIDIAAVVSAWEMEDGRAFADLLRRLERRSVRSRLLEGWMAQLPPLSRQERDLLSAIVTHGLRAGTLEGAARDLRLSERTLRRRLSTFVPCEGTCILRRARIDSVYLRRQLGGSRTRAIEAAGFSSPDAFKKSRRRDRRRRVEGLGCELRAVRSNAPCPFYYGTAV